MAKKRTAVFEEDEKHFSFETTEKALSAYGFACRIVENKFFMDPSGLVKIADRVVTVPKWFPYTV